MANVLVVIELSGNRPLPVCLEALGQARRVSTHLGATLYAVVPMVQPPKYGEDELIAILSRSGADKVVLVTDEHAGGTPFRWGTHGGAIAQVSDMLPPSLLLFGHTPGGREVAPRAAARMGAAFLCEAWLEVREDHLQLWQGDGDAAVALDGELEFPVVATVPTGRYKRGAGDDEAEVEVMPAVTRAADFEELGWEADAQPPAMVLAPDGMEPAARLAAALGGKVAPSVDRDTAPRLAISLGPPLDAVRGELRVALGDAAANAGAANYALVAPAADAAKALAEAIEATRFDPPSGDED